MALAKILYIEDDPTAIKAIEGFIRRSPYLLTHVKNSAEAWDKLSESVDYDVIIAELKLQGSNTASLIKDIRNNQFLKKLPIIMYSKIQDRKVIKSILALGIQNFLFKPYKERLIFEEVERAIKTNWRLETSGPIKKFSRCLDEELHSFHAGNKNLLEKMEFLIGAIQVEKATSDRNISNLIEDIAQLSILAKKLAFTSFSDMLDDIVTKIKEESWSTVYKALEYYPSAQTLQRYRLDYIENAVYIATKDGSTHVDEKEESLNEIETRYTLEETVERTNEIKDYPVLESAVAAFQMVLDDEESNLDEIVEMVQRDSGLATSLLRFANMSDIAPGSAISDIHQAISTLGLQRTKLLALSLKSVPEMSSMFSVFEWEKYWMHQIGCAMLSEELAKQLKLPTHVDILYITGLMQDIGKILLHEIDNDLYKQAVRISKTKNIPLRELEREYFGCSHEHVGAIFAEESNLPVPIQEAIKYQFEPDKEAYHRDAVSALSLANHLCMTYEIGDNGDRPIPGIFNLASHPAWGVLSTWFTPGFSESIFTHNMESKIKTLKVNLAWMAKEQSERHRKAQKE